MPKFNLFKNSIPIIGGFLIETGTVLYFVIKEYKNEKEIRCRDIAEFKKKNVGVPFKFALLPPRPFEKRRLMVVENRKNLRK